MMSALEIILVASVVGAAVFYLVRRLWMSWRGIRAGCCGHCPLGGRKIPLAGRSGRGSIGIR